MPVMGGRDTLTRIREKTLQIPIIVSSGFAPDHESLEIKLDNKTVFFLPKPYRSEDLLKIIANLY
jgi:CheY-like chemotaxis protein